MTFLSLLLSAALVNNIVLHYLFGVGLVGGGVSLTVAWRLRVAAAVAAVTLPLLPAAAVAAFALERVARAWPEVAAFRHLLLVLCVFALARLADRPARRLAPELVGGGWRLGGLLGVNSLLLAGALMSLQPDVGVGGGGEGFALSVGGDADWPADLAATLVFGFGAAVGFGVVLLAFTALDARLREADAPVAFRGLSLQLIALGLLSMAFLGFAGVGRHG